MIVKQITSNFLVLFILLFHFPINTAQQTSSFQKLNCIRSPAPHSTLFGSYLSGMITLALKEKPKQQAFYFHYAYSYSNTYRVFYSYLCRGDINGTRCNDCIIEAAKTALQSCNLTSKEAIIWKDECMFRYSDQNFNGLMQESPAFSVPSNSTNATSTFNVEKFDQALKQVTGDLVASLDPVDSPYGKKFATANVSVSDGKIYAAGECTWDLQPEDCISCLQDCIKMLPPGKMGWRVLFPSCSVRFETYQFYHTGPLLFEPKTARRSPPSRPDPRPTTTTPPLPPPSDYSTPPTGKHGNPSRGRKIDPPRPSHVPEIASTGATLVAMILLISCALYYAHKRRRSPEFRELEEITSAESLQIDIHKIRVATHNFAADKKLGQGGFGEVFKGKLDSGQVVAVKRLSRDSGQGIEEFKTEILLVANLQHRNLVKLLGFCFSGKEKILVYEFLANSSLDKILFDPRKRETLSWETRFKIISGIAKGLSYLHEDSRLKIIHRDLKASNILLDEFMNPKISDFGMAKLFGVDQTQDATKTIVGTYGYMAPEYMLIGQYSVKSDVYSFGIIILEIVTGVRNSYMNRPRLEEALLHRAWRLWNEDSAFELVDYVLGDAYSREEVKKCIHIGLLCIQEDAARRPKMTWVLGAIRDETSFFPEPTPPNFFNSIHSRSHTGGSTSTDPAASSSIPREPLTELYGR